MCVRKCECICVYVHCVLVMVCVSTCVSICMCVCVCVYIHLCTYICTCVSVCVSACVRICVCVTAYILLCSHICMCVSACTLLQMYTHLLSQGASLPLAVTHTLRSTVLPSRPHIHVTSLWPPQARPADTRSVQKSPRSHW